MLHGCKRAIILSPLSLWSDGLDRDNQVNPLPSASLSKTFRKLNIILSFILEIEPEAFHIVTFRMWRGAGTNSACERGLLLPPSADACDIYCRLLLCENQALRSLGFGGHPEERSCRSEQTFSGQFGSSLDHESALFHAVMGHKPFA